MGTGLQAWRTLITSLFHRFPDRTSCHVPLRNSSKVSVCIHLSSWRLGRRAHAHATAKRPPRALCRHSEGERNERQASSPDCRRRSRTARAQASGGEGANTTATASDLAASVSRSFSRSRCTLAGRGRPIRGGSGRNCRDGDHWERGGLDNSISPLQFIC